MFNNSRIGTKIAASFALGLGIFAAIAAVSYQGTQQLVDRAKWEAHTFEVLQQLKDLDNQFLTTQYGLRGYLITGNQQDLEPYAVAIPQLTRSIEKLRRLTEDNSGQQRRLDELEGLVETRKAQMEQIISLRGQRGLAETQALANSDPSRRQNISSITTLITQMADAEQRLLGDRSNKADVAARRTLDSIAYGIPIYSILLAMIGFTLARHISRPLREISAVADQVGAGDLSVTVPPNDRQDEIGVLNRTINQMIVNLRDTTQKTDDLAWLKSNLTDVTRMLQGQRNQETVARSILSKVVPLVGAQQGVFYVLDSEADPPLLKLLGSYAFQERKNLANQFHLGEGLVGQCALENQRILLTNAPNDYIRIRSGLGEALPLNIVVLPIQFEKQVVAVLELASFQRFTPIHLAFLEQATEGIGVVLNTIAADTRTAILLQQTQALAEELEHQQKELRESNRRLEEQADALRSSEMLLKEQQEELQQTNEELQQLNEELEEKAELLETQKREVERKNQEIETARQTLAEKAAQLAQSSKYKSEFLANMSHELRTPLNSLLILARLLSDNGEGNLSEKQVEYSRTIYLAGTDLLELINDILDLAKIESGMMSLNVEPMPFSELQLYLDRTFRQVAQSKSLDFTIELDNDLPNAIVTDAKRLQQVLKNLLSNAFKFTDRGGITLQITAATYLFTSNTLHQHTAPGVAFSVSDTGIGIPAEKQKIIFEAFQQADGTTSRRYGGTGLGLSISRELTQLLGGSIDLVSETGKGSTFTLHLPLDLKAQPGDLPSAAPPPADRPSSDRGFISAPSFDPTPPAIDTSFPEVPDDRASIQPGDRVLLIIEDDVNFARILLEMARQNGFKALVSLRGTPGLAMAMEFQPDAVMLDLRLPDLDGWAVLDRLKHDSNTRHIPVHILSVDEAQQRGLQLGAIAYLQKPVSPETLTQALDNIKGFVDRPVKRLLVIEDDPTQANSIIELIGNGDVQSTATHTGAEALEILRLTPYDCVVLDLGLPDMNGFDLIEQIKQDPRLVKLPIIVYTGKELSRQEETQLKRLAETIIVKDVRSPERLLDETALFLHRVQANLPPPKRQMLEQLHQSDPVLAGKKVLIVDDDVRNIFALTSLLERYQVQVFYAENGKDGILALENHNDVDVVLMDVMMPEMDGYETTRAIRQQEQFRSLPIIALTAKAMQGDREKCLEAGASDYITKPVDTEQLLSLMRVWLYR